MWSVALVVVVCLGTHAPSRAGADESVPAVRIAALIRSLGSDSFRERQRADDELMRLGNAARNQLEEALAAGDPEVRLRVESLLERLKVGQLWAASQVFYRTEEETASTILRDLGQQTGNRILVGDQYGKFHDGPVKLSYEAGPFWEVIDDLCRQSGNHVRPHYDTRQPGLVVVAGPPGEYPIAYAGPVRAQVTSARRVFIEELDYQKLGSDTTHTFQLNLQVMWEDRFQLVAYRAGPELIEAVTDTGVELSAAQSSGTGWNVASRGTRQLSMNLRLHPPPTSAASLARLRLSWGLIAVGDMAALDVEDLETANRTYRQDDLELTVQSVEARPGGRIEVSLAIMRDRVVPQPHEVLFQENDFELYDAKGRAFVKQGQSNTLSQQGANVRLTFSPPEAESAPARLRVVYPRLRSQQNLEIAFHDVPLPSRRPE